MRIIAKTRFGRMVGDEYLLESLPQFLLILFQKPFGISFKGTS